MPMLLIQFRCRLSGSHIRHCSSRELLEKVVNPAQVDAFRLQERYSLGIAAVSRVVLRWSTGWGPDQNCSDAQKYESHVALENMFTFRKIQMGTPMSEPESTFRQSNWKGRNSSVIIWTGCWVDNQNSILGRGRHFCRCYHVQSVTGGKEQTSGGCSLC